MKSFEHELIVLGGCIIMLLILAISLNKLAEPRQKEEQRRSEMYKYIGDEETR